VHPLIAVQRYGRGRSIVFGGEAAWRWRMLRPAEDHSYEYFWRQSLRWLAGAAPDPVSLAVPDSAEPGDAVDLQFDVRDRSFTPVPDAAIEATLSAPGGEERRIVPEASGDAGRFTARVAVDRPGLHRVRARATRRGAELGVVDRFFYVGGSDREFADPRLNEAVLRRLAHGSGGEYLPADRAREVVSSLHTTGTANAELERRDLWDRPWVFLLLVALLAGEWVLRRRWGLR
jgi:hypothetical protein